MTSLPRATLLAAVLCAGLPAPLLAQTFTFERTLPATGNTAVDVSSGRGRIKVSVGDSDEVHISGTVTVRSGINVPVNAGQLAQAAASRPPITEASRTIQIREPGDPMVRAAVTISYDIKVPPGVKVTTESSGGASSLEGLAGLVSVRTSSGAITLARLSGVTTVETGSGDVTITAQSGAISVTTKSSRISAQGLAANVTARTGSGAVTLAYSGRGDADVQTQSSGVDIEGLDGGLKAVTGSGHVRVTGAPRSAWTVTTGSGAVDVILGGDASATVEATTGGGSVRVDKAYLAGTIGPRRASGTINGGGPTMTLTSRSATITITGR